MVPPHPPFSFDRLTSSPNRKPFAPSRGAASATTSTRRGSSISVIPTPIINAMLAASAFDPAGRALRSMPVLTDRPVADMSDAEVLIISGETDDYGRYAEELRRQLVAGADVEARVVPNGHELTDDDVPIIRDWLSGSVLRNRLSASATRLALRALQRRRAPIHQIHVLEPYRPFLEGAVSAPARWAERMNPLRPRTGWSAKRLLGVDAARRNDMTGGDGRHQRVEADDVGS